MNPCYCCRIGPTLFLSSLAPKTWVYFCSKRCCRTKTFGLLSPVHTIFLSTPIQECNKARTFTPALARSYLSDRTSFSSRKYMLYGSGCIVSFPRHYIPRIQRAAHQPLYVRGRRSGDLIAFGVYQTLCTTILGTVPEDCCTCPKSQTTRFVKVPTSDVVLASATSLERSSLFPAANIIPL